MIPKPIYEILPVMYVVGGILAMLSVHSFTSFSSGLLMGITGLVVLTKRRNYRSTLATKNHIQIPATANN